MSWSNFPIDPRATLVADSSVVINLNATGCAAHILAAIGSPVAVADSVVRELEEGGRNGHGDAAALNALIESGHIRSVSLGSAGYKMYERLIDGSTENTLDDGEAATIACAIELSGVALIDERKALRLCAQIFPTLALVPTIGILLSEPVSAALGQIAQANALFAALQIARMRIPLPYLSQAVALIGEERAKACPSLPRHAFRQVRAV